MAFDPMTGEPIEDNENSQLQFDPMTGEPIGQQSATQQEPTGFDPMTGEPIYGQQTISQEEQPTGFDPMTGEPIYGQQIATQEEQPTGFDPMTGQPIYGQQTAAQQQPAGTDKKKNTRLPLILGIVGGIAAVAILVVVLINSGIFLGKGAKVAVATANTFKELPRFAEDLEGLKILAEDKYTITASCKVEDIKMNMEARISDKEKQFYALVDAKDYPKLEVLAGIDSTKAKIQIPALTDYVFSYNYTGKNTGYLLEELDEEEIDTFNSMLEYIAEGNDGISKAEKEFTEVLTKEFKTIKFTNAEKESYTVNEKDVNCKGYTATITGDNVANIITGFENVINDNYEALYGNETLDTDDIADFFDELRDSCDDMEDIEVTFYIYENQLAAVKLTNEEAEDDIELCFEGGSYRIQNMEFRAGSDRIQLKGEDNGKTENLTLREKSGKGKWSEIASLEYNYESGKFTLTEDEYTLISGKITKSKSGLGIKIDTIGGGYNTINPGLEITISKGAKFDKYVGKEFDLGNADEDEFMDMAEEVEDELYDSDLYYLLEELF